MALQQFLVPQFIDVEDKIFGPITVRQFVIMLAALVLGAMEYSLLSFMPFLVMVLTTTGLAATFAFGKKNGRPIHFFLLNFAQALKRPSRRIWNKEAYVKGVKVIKSEIKEKAKAVASKAMVTGSKLQDLSLIINTGGVYQTDEDFDNADNIPQENVTAVSKEVPPTE